MKMMKTLALLSLSLAVTLGLPAVPPGGEGAPELSGQEQRPPVADWTPVQGHVVEEDPAPGVRTAQREEDQEMKFQENVEAETSQEVQERHIDMEGRNEKEGEPIMELEPLAVNHPLPEGEGLMSGRDNVPGEEPIMELEPLDDVNASEEKLSDTEMSEVEKSLIAAFQNHIPVNQPLPEGEGLMRGMDYDVDEEPIMELEPEEGGAPALDIMGQPRASLREDLPEDTKPSPSQDQQGRRYCLGVVSEGRCYEFFKGPKTHVEAEFFCQGHVSGGHLASITSQQIQRDVVMMILMNNAATTRTWIGGLRYVDTGRFLWLDGSRWSYSDWLSGEPSSANEECVEMLASGKFNDYSCSVSQTFVCSYPHQLLLEATRPQGHEDSRTQGLKAMTPA